MQKVHKEEIIEKNKLAEGLTKYSKEFIKVKKANSLTNLNSPYNYSLINPV